VYGGGLSYLMGKETFKAQYYTRSDSGDSAGGDMISLGIDHSFNDNMIVYVAYSVTRNDQTSKYTMSGDGHGDVVVPAEGDDPSGFSIGMIYIF
jgi:predicted porin